jgi:phosphoserine phosphatase
MGLFTATLIAEGGLDDILPEMAHQFLMDCTAGTLRSCDWIERGVAGDLTFAPAQGFGAEDCAVLAAGLSDRAAAIAKGGEGRDLAVDVVVQPSAHRAKRLLVADLDSTIITVECIDELADYAGLKNEVAAITERAMRGELDFERALESRVALLADLDAELIDRCREERVRITPGAQVLVRTMSAHGATCILVSGGFTRFADAVAETIGFDRVVANVLEVERGRLSGRVAPPIVGAETKRQVLLETAAELALPIEATLAVGDGANDIPMLKAAGLGVAYHAKEAAAAAADARIEHNDLTALLYAQGYKRDEWEAG